MTGEGMEEPQAAREAYMNAVLAEDGVAAAATYAGDVCRFPSGPAWFYHGIDEIRQEWSEWMERPPVRYRAFRWLDGPYGERRGDLAWIAGILEQDYEAADGGDFSRHLRISMVLRNTPEGWRIAMEHNSRPSAEPYKPGESRYR